MWSLFIIAIYSFCVYSVLSKKYEAKLCDFGFSIIRQEAKTFSEASATTRVDLAGTLYWTAPELLAVCANSNNTTTKQEYNNIYAKADVYSFGIVCINTVWSFSNELFAGYVGNNIATDSILR